VVSSRLKWKTKALAQFVEPGSEESGIEAEPSQKRKNKGSQVVDITRHPMDIIGLFPGHFAL
jgi:hypothetical protein